MLDTPVEMKDRALDHALSARRLTSTPATASEIIADAKKIYAWLKKDG